jgi:hypothetical protein
VVPNEGTVRILEAVNLVMRQQHLAERREALVTKALHSIINRLFQFDGWNLSKYIQFYTQEIELSRICEEEMVASFELTVILEICERAQELQASDGNSWQAFAQALKEEYFTEDLERVIKRTFLE